MFIRIMNYFDRRQSSTGSQIYTEATLRAVEVGGLEDPRIDFLLGAFFEIVGERLDEIEKPIVDNSGDSDDNR